MVGNDGWESSATDIIGIHDYDANLEQLRQRYGAEIEREQLFEERRPGGRILTLDAHPHRGQPIVLTEFGGIAYDKRRAAGVDNVWGYSVVHDDEEFARNYHQLLHVIANTALFSGFCYTQFTDTFQEANGLLYADRTPKIPLELIAEATSASPTHVRGVV